MATRDFSDSALTEFRATAESLEADTFSIDDLEHWFDEAPGIGDRFNDVGYEQRKKTERYNESLRKVDAIFNNVRAYDAGCTNTMAPVLEQIRVLKESAAGLTDCINPHPANGTDCALRLGTALLIKRLAVSNQALHDLIWNKLASTGEDGTIIYNWDAIEAVVDKNFEDMTQMEFYVLAELYATMGADDMTMFFQRLAVLNNDPATSASAITNGQSFSSWGFDEQKVNALSYYMELNYNQNLENMSDIELQGYSTRLELLNVMPTIGLPGMNGPGIHAGPDDKYPFLEIDWNDTECVVSYLAQAFILVIGPKPYEDPFHEYEIHIFNRDAASSATETVNNLLNNELQEYFQPPFGSREILFLITEGASYIPYVGYGMPVISAGTFLQDMVEKRELARYSGEMLEGSSLLASTYEPLGCKATIAYGTEDPNSIRISVFKGRDTDDHIAALNTILENGAYEIPSGIVLPIDYETIVNNPSEVDYIMNSLNESDHDRVLNPT